jgi:NodT family efflux transporter outer membrane factor (OMF) lipoprotein
MHCRLAITALLATAAALLAGCALPKPAAQAEAVELPAAYRNVDALGAAARTQDGAATNAATSHWWHGYGNAELNDLVERALAHNVDLRIASAQIKQAKIRAEQARAGHLPSVIVPGRVVAQGNGGTVDTQQSSQLSLQGTYRVDIWGEQKSLVESADMQVLRANFEYENAKRNVIANLIGAYISYLAVQDSIVLAAENADASQRIVQMVEQRLSLGDATRDEVEQQRATLAALQAAAPALEDQLDNIKTVISRWVGALPGSLRLMGNGLEQLQIPAVPAEVPGSLIFSRPDIKVVEARMGAAHANIELARARLMPPIDLVVQSGFSGLALSELLLPQSFFWASAASFTATVFDGGRRQNEWEFADAYYEEMALTYRQTVYQAVREVESAISGVNTTQRRLEAQKRMSRAELNRVKSSADAFEAQAIDAASVLEAQKNYKRSVEEVLRLKAELLRAHASLFQALGQGEGP